MYEDSWYSFVPEHHQKRGAAPGTQNPGHRRRESLLQQPNGATEHADATNPLSSLLEEQDDPNSPPHATLLRRANSYSDFYDIVTAQLSKGGSKKKRRKRRDDRTWEALVLPEPPSSPQLESVRDDAQGKALLLASQQEYILYHDQLATTERHLGSLIEDAESALKDLEILCQSFRAVEDQTKTFQSQCDDLLSEEKRLQTVADEVGTDLHFYAYLDNVTRRLNAPGAGRLVEDDAFGEVLANLESCIAFMSKNPTYRDAEQYLARYQSLLTKALHLLEVGFTNRLEKVSAEISRQIVGTQSESARHALAYGRFEEMLAESYALIPNVQRVVRSAYDQNGLATSGPNFEMFAMTTNNLFQAYWAVRDRDLKPVTQQEQQTFRTEATAESVETGARNLVKQCFERSYNEGSLFRRVFSIEAQYSTDPKSAFVALKTPNRALVTGTNIVPIGTNLQSVLQTSDLQTICNVVGWLTNEYLLLDYDEDETPFTSHCRGLTARLLAEHLWTFTDAFFEAEIAKSISRAVIAPEALKIGAAANGNASSNAFPPVRRAVELLGMFDQSMPKERCQRDSPVVFKIVKESIAALHRAETRIKSSRNGTDPDLFMIKNLLMLKNELLALEIGDVRSSESQANTMQHFGQIWGTLRPQNLVGLLSSFSTYIPGSSYWSSSRTGVPTPANGGGASADVQDASEQLDEQLRQSIYAFTRRWATALNEAQGRKLGGKNLAKVERELEEMLDRAFPSQPEVVGKLKEAIEIEAQAQKQAQASKT
ncbi:oligomeric Golgi complex subunit 3 [Podospora aff. communis PSN243]|uniref:Conserved oligomeric Golgi complex subunit 3 n=1 Tax=Podospora aff. communis PSN243 TaxID=3040156 RepID=A0AAV9GA68_9PEZI|nr:oligomeric Golgi complex subunit 3 [Podospora aff. communis PSN243]